VKFGYWADLSSLQLDDSAEPATWIQAMPLGEYDHPVYGPIQITAEKIRRFAQNVNDEVRGTELDIDYDHKAYGGEAAGWVKKAEARPDGLYLLVSWTKKAASLLKDKAYRYFSPEFNDEWKHPKTQETHKDVLFGGAITNRPFLKDILPINMSDLFTTGAPTAPPAPAPQIPSEGGHMDPKKLREALGLQEDASDADVVAKLAEGLNPTPPAPTPPAPTSTLPVPAATASPGDVAALLKQLSDVDGNPAIKALTDLVKAQQTQLADVVQQRKVERIDRQLADLDAGKKFAVPPAVKEQLRDILLRSPEELGQQVLSAYQETLKLGVIDLSERGWQRRGDDKSPTQMYLTAVDEMMSKPNNKLSYAQAAARVAAENPTLAAQYREESYIPSEGR
jgi:phage I-like protein